MNIISMPAGQLLGPNGTLGEGGGGGDGVGVVLMKATMTIWLLINANCSRLRLCP